LRHSPDLRFSRYEEERTSDGRIDISLKLPNAIYILEFKYAKTSEGVY